MGSLFHTGLLYKMKLKRMNQWSIPYWTTERFTQTELTQAGRALSCLDWEPWIEVRWSTPDKPSILPRMLHSWEVGCLLGDHCILFWFPFEKEKLVKGKKRWGKNSPKKKDKVLRLSSHPMKHFLKCLD